MKRRILLFLVGLIVLSAVHFASAGHPEVNVKDGEDKIDDSDHDGLNIDEGRKGE